MVVRRESWITRCIATDGSDNDRKCKMKENEANYERGLHCIPLVNGLVQSGCLISLD